VAIFNIEIVVNYKLISVIHFVYTVSDLRIGIRLGLRYSTL